jgi:hypothetical protein
MIVVNKMKSVTGKMKAELTLVSLLAFLAVVA